jgi:mono/diheme cytochrome c family protein
MNKAKSLIATLLHVALAVFIIVAIWPALKSNSDGYSGAVPVAPEVVVVGEVVEPEPELVVEPEPIIETAGISSEAVTVDTEMEKENENEDALYSVIDGDKLDANSYAGFKLYRNWCARCHGTYGQGMVGPNLADSLNIIDEKEFFNVVANGKTGTIGSMPAWKANPKVMAGRDQLYAYLMARADGAIGVVKPKKQ